MKDAPSPQPNPEEITLKISKKKLLLGLAAVAFLLFVTLLLRSEKFRQFASNLYPTPTPTATPTPSPTPQITYSVSGKIIDIVDKREVSDATIKIGEQETHSATTGEFQLGGITPGTKTVTISRSGYQAYTQEISVEGNLDLENISLVPAGRILFVSNRSGMEAIYTATLDGKNIQRLWNNPPEVEDYGVALAPDKSRIVFFSNRDQDGEDRRSKANLYFADLNNLKIERVSEIINPIGVKFFPDSQSILYQKSDYDLRRHLGVAELRRFNFSNRGTTVLVENDDFKKEGGSTPSLDISQAQIAPNGKWIAFYASLYGNPVSPSGVYIIRADGQGLRLLVSRNPVTDLEFSADSSSITYKVYVNGAQKTYRYHLNTNTEREIHAKEASKVLSAVGDGPSYYYSSWPSEVVSHDKTKVAFRDFRDGRTDLFVKNIGANSDRRLTQRGGVDRIFWTPSDRYIIFSVNRPTENAAYIVGLTPESLPLKITEIYSSSSLAGFLP